MANTRVELNKQIKTVIKSLQAVLLKQFGGNKKPEDLTPQEKYKIYVLNEILEKAAAFYVDSVGKKFTTDCAANNELPEEQRKETGPILAEALQLLDNEFGAAGNQQRYIDSAAKAYRDIGNNGISVSKNDISEADNAVFLCVLTTYGRLMRQLFCFKQLADLGATEGYADSAYIIKKSLEEGVKKIKPGEVARLNEERTKFTAIFEELLSRIFENKNLKTFDAMEGDAELAVLIREINSQLFNKHGKSKLPTQADLIQLKQDAKDAAAQGREEELLLLQRQAKAIDIYVADIAKNLSDALREYSVATHAKVGRLDEDFKKDMQESLRAGTDIIKMRYILAIADTMHNPYPFEGNHRKDKDDYALLKTDAETLAAACAKNGWKNVGIGLKAEMDALTSSLVAFNEQLRDKRVSVQLVGGAYSELKTAFDKQCEAHEKFPNDLTKALGNWNKESKKAIAPAYFDANWHAKCEEVLRIKPSGFRAFINRHKAKMLAGGIVGAVAGAAAVALGIVVFALSWYLLVAAAVALVIIGVAAGALGGKISDKRCRVEPLQEDFSAADAGFLLRMDLPADASPRRLRGSSAVVVKATQGSEEDRDAIELQERQSQCSSDEDSEIVIDFDQLAAHLDAAQLSPAPSPSPSPSK